VIVRARYRESSVQARRHNQFSHILHTHQFEPFRGDVGVSSENFALGDVVRFDPSEGIGGGGIVIVDEFLDCLESRIIELTWSPTVIGDRLLIIRNFF